jgi:hypothetical protein
MVEVTKSIAVEIYKTKIKIMTDLKLTIDGVERDYKIPDSWNDITVEGYQKIVNMPKDLTGVFLSIELAIRMTGMSREIIEELPIEEFNKILDRMTFVNSEMGDHLKESVEIDGETYFFKKDFTKLTTGEVASIDLILNSSDNNWYNVIEKLLCIFLRKKVDGELEKFKSEMMDRADKFKRLKITDVQPIFFYFSSGVTGSQNDMKDSSVKPKSANQETQDSI